MQLLDSRSCINDVSTYDDKQSSPASPFLVQLSQLLSGYQLNISLQRLEILNPIESQYTQQYVSVSIKLAGWLNISSFKQRIDRLVQKLLIPHKHLSATDQERETNSLLSCPTSVINLTRYSSAQQLYEVQRRQSLYAQNAMDVLKRSHIEVHLFCLGQQEQLLHFILQQNICTTGSFQTFMRELMNLFHTGKQAGQVQKDREDIPRESVEDTTACLLSSRELEVLQCIAEGLSNREIAQRCVITEGTVKRHTNNIYSKLGVRSRTQAIMQAKLLGLLSA